MTPQTCFTLFQMEIYIVCNFVLLLLVENNVVVVVVGMENKVCSFAYVNNPRLVQEKALLPHVIITFEQMFDEIGLLF